MKFHDSTCTFDNLREKRSFRIDRHALRIIQPIVYNENLGQYRLDCKSDQGRKFGRIDFSRGFQQWWFLSHTDIHLPSEHTQGGKRYDAELQMYHFYSVPAEQAGIHNEVRFEVYIDPLFAIFMIRFLTEKLASQLQMAAVTVFLEAYDNAADWPILNRIICAWREEEEKTRQECGLHSAATKYSGCSGYTSTNNSGTSKAQGSSGRTLSVHDVILQNHFQTLYNSTAETSTVAMDPEQDFADMSDFDWDAFIAQQYVDKKHTRRELLNYDGVEWFNYFALLDVRTEYYYRYSGTQTIPPCYGLWFPNNDRHQTNHWRIMKDPVRISPRQLKEMNRLLRDRIAPQSDPIVPCQPDTAGKVVNGAVSTNRPLQKETNVHYQVFCECQDWTSKFKEDQQWCKQPQTVRYFDHPYNFATNGF
jgi:Eukaryotic-type carbonic anhydrase